MSSIQERLQLKRVPLDTWNIREQLCLASAVVRSGDQNWMSVSRALKTVGDPNRPTDWYSQKSCAAQYGALLEHVETPKRKKRNSEGAGETPQESILKRLTQERIAEIQKNVTEMNHQYTLLKNEIAEVRNNSTSEERVRELWTGIEAGIRARERETARRAAWLREREERRARAERGRPSSPAPTTPSSPLLTSLLKSSPVVTTPQHISHPANSVDSMSPSAGAPTLSMLLEKSSTQHDNKHAAIEHIKSQLVQIEQQLKDSLTPPPTSSLQEPVPAVDIDDIEIKAEDVYAFRDVDIEIPPVAAMHKAQPVRAPEKPSVAKKEEDDSQILSPSLAQDMSDSQIRENVTSTDETINVDSTSHEMVPADVQEAAEAVAAVQPPPEVKISFPEVKFPTPEIKVISAEDQKIKEEIGEVEVATPQQAQKEELVTPAPVILESPPVVEPETVAEPTSQTIEEIIPAETQIQEEEKKKDIETEKDAENKEISEAKDEIPTPASAPEAVISKEATPEPPDRTTTEPEPAPVAADHDIDEDKSLEEVKKDVQLEESATPKETHDEGAAVTEAKKEKESEDTHTETDDDTPMELVREEEKDGKKKRDYSRKKKPDSRTCSGSESAAETSAPDSPTVSDSERQHRLWRKSVMMVYNRLAAHKYASLFLRPISDTEAPGYSQVVKRPMDLGTIKKNIDNGVIRTTAEFQRDVLLMLTNALIYNSSEHRVYQMAKEMFHDAENQLGMLLAAQAHAGLGTPARRRRHADVTVADTTLGKRRHD